MWAKEIKLLYLIPGNAATKQSPGLGRLLLDKAEPRMSTVDVCVDDEVCSGPIGCQRESRFCERFSSDVLHSSEPRLHKGTASAQV